MQTNMNTNMKENIITSKKVFYLGSFTIAYIFFAIAFFVIRESLKLLGIEYRFWLSAVGHVVVLITPMVLLILWIKMAFSIMIAQRQEAGLSVQGCKNAQITILVVFAIVCVIILLFAGLFGIVTMQEERVTDDGTLQVMYGGFPTESYWYDYERISFWGRKQAVGLKEQEMLEHKYRCEFTIDDGGFDIGEIFYIPANDPDLLVSVYGGYNGKAQVDDYAQRYLSAVFHEGKKKYYIESECGDTYFNEPYSEFYLWIDDSEENRKTLADNAATLITYTLKELEQDTDAPCDGGVLYVSILQEIEQYGTERYNAKIPFGNTGKAEFAGKEKDYYTSAEHVYQAMQEQLPAVQEPLFSSNEYEEDIGNSGIENSEIVNEEPEMPTQPAEGSWEAEIEELAKCIYDEELADAEDHFEMTYNAKGNPYAILGEGRKQLDSGELVQTRRTLVYDRTSQNGMCELFVYYEEKYDLEGNQLDNTAILDMYAVDKESHEVYPSGRQAWADAGNAAYREATGE